MCHLIRQLLSKRPFLHLRRWCLTRVLFAMSLTFMASRFRQEHKLWDLNKIQSACQQEAPAEALSLPIKALLRFQWLIRVLGVQTTRSQKADLSQKFSKLPIKLAKTLWTCTSTSQCRQLKWLPIQSLSCLKRHSPALWSRQTQSSTREKSRTLYNCRFHMNATRVAATKRNI